MQLQNMKITLIFPMAGEGARFGYKFKPFLKFNNEYFIEKTLKPFLKFDQVIDKIVFVYLAEHEKKYQVSENLKKIMLNLNLKYINIVKTKIKNFIIVLFLELF